MKKMCQLCGASEELSRSHRPKRSTNTLRNRVEKFIAHGAGERPDTLLEVCASDGSLDALVCVTRMFQDIYGGISKPFEVLQACLVNFFV
jgi:hypothetical protein